MAHVPFPAQRSLFPQPTPAAEVIASLPAWPAADLENLVRAASCELLRRCRAVPIAAPVAQAAYAAMAAEYPVPSTQ